MSLKALHIVFIVASTLLAFGFGAWSFREYSSSDGIWNLVFGIGSTASGIALIFYGKAILRKLKDISYL